MALPTATDNKSSSFCIMPWVHLHVSQNGNAIPCCQAPPHKVHRFGNVNEQSVSEIWKSEAIQAFREKMLKNEKDHRCKQCYIKEDNGAKSLRQITNEKYDKEVNQVLKNGQIEHDFPIHFDVRFSNACNLKCRICGPWASSQWHKDAVALGMRDKDSKALSVALNDEDSFFEEITPLLPEAKEFYFAGGEPLMMEQHYKVLDALLACGNTSIRLSYNTNFSTLEFKDYKVVEYWKQFKNIHVTASLDAEGSEGEFLRKNLKWDKVIENRKTCLNQLPQLHFQVAPTVCVFNVALLPDFHKNWVAKGFIAAEDFIPNILIHPKEYQLTILSLEDQMVLKAKYREHIAWMKHQEINDKASFLNSLQQFESIEAQLGDTTSESIESFLKITKKLDVLRKENASEIFPHIVSFD